MTMIELSRRSRITTAARALVAVSALAGSIDAQQLREREARFVLLRDVDVETLRFRLNDLASRGYHIVLASTQELLLETRRNGVADVEYRVLPPEPVASFTRTVNAAIAQGYRQVPSGFIYDRSTKPPGVGAVMERPINRAVQPAIAEPSFGVARYQYKTLTNPSESSLARHHQEGFDVIDLVVAPLDDYDENVFALMARASRDRGAREASKQFARARAGVASLESRLNELVRRGYRLRLVGREERFEPALLFERSSSARTRAEYEVVRMRKGDTTLELRLNEAAARGFRLQPGRHIRWGGDDPGEALILEKLADGGSGIGYMVMSLDNLNVAGTLGAFTVVDVLLEARNFVPRPRIILEVGAR